MYISRAVFCLEGTLIQYDASKATATFVFGQSAMSVCCEHCAACGGECSCWLLGPRRKESCSAVTIGLHIH